MIFTDENFIAKKLNHRVRANPPPPEVNGDLAQTEVADNDLNTLGMQKVLSEIEDKVFPGPVKIY